MPFRLRGRKEIDFPYKVENNIYFLYPFPVHPFRRMDYDFLDKFIDDCGGKFLYPHILADNRGEAVKVAFVLFVGIDFLLVCLDLFFQFPLFASYSADSFKNLSWLIVGRQIEGDTNCELFFQPLSH